MRRVAPSPGALRGATLSLVRERDGVRVDSRLKLVHPQEFHAFSPFRFSNRSRVRFARRIVYIGSWETW